MIEGQRQRQGAMQGDAAVGAPDRQRDSPADAQDGHLRRHHDQRRMTAGDGSEIRQRDGRAAQIGGRQASGLPQAGAWNTVPMAIPQGLSQRWSMDFLSDGCVDD